MLRAWLRTPEVARWWGDPDEQVALLEGDLRDPRMVMLIVSYQGRPFAYAQHYAVESWPQRQFASLPPGSRAIDPFIGEPELRGRGHGAALLRLLAQHLIADGAPVVAIDPDCENERARRAYARAGFHGEEVVATDEGPVTVMRFTG